MKRWLPGVLFVAALLHSSEGALQAGSTVLSNPRHNTFPLSATLTAIGNQPDSLPVLRYHPQANTFPGEERWKALDELLQGYVRRQELNGLTTMVVRKGEVLYQRAFGNDDPAKGKRMDPGQIFRIASMTKPVVSVALMMLYEEGKFQLSDPVSKFIPEFKNPRIITSFNLKDTSYQSSPASGEITIRHLLTHTSGIGYPQIGSPQAKALYGKQDITGGIAIGKAYDLGQQVRKLASLPLFHEPGEQYTYGFNSDVVGYLIEVISGQPLEEFLQEKLFRPLGMKDTHFRLPQEKKDRLARMYTQGKDGKAVPMPDSFFVDRWVQTNYPLSATPFPSGGAGLVSTMQDYAIFLQMILNHGTYNGHVYLSKHTVRQITSNHLFQLKKPDPVFQFGLGFGITGTNGSALEPLSPGTISWGGMFNTHFWADPVENVIIIGMTNIWPSDAWNWMDRTLPVIYRALN